MSSCPISCPSDGLPPSLSPQASPKAASACADGLMSFRVAWADHVYPLIWEDNENLLATMPVRIEANREVQSSQGDCEQDQEVITAWRCQLADVLLHCGAFSPSSEIVADISVEASMQAAAEEADEKTRLADASLRRLSMNVKAAGRFLPELNVARHRLQAATEPPARGAAEAQRAVHSVIPRVPAFMELAEDIAKADRDVRDIVVLRCRACCRDPKDREAFKEMALEAYSHELDTDAKALLLLSYSKDPATKDIGFPSNNAVDAKRRGRTRPRGRHSRAREMEEAGAFSAGQPAAVSSAPSEPMWVYPGGFGKNWHHADSSCTDDCRVCDRKPWKPARMLFERSRGFLGSVAFLGR